MALIKFDLVYRNFKTHDVDDSHSVTVQATNVNAGIRKAVLEATAVDTRPAGYSLVEIKWVPLV